MWLLLHLTIVFSGELSIELKPNHLLSEEAHAMNDLNLKIRNVKIHDVKIRSSMESFEKKHIQACNKIRNRLRFIADAEAIENRMREQYQRMQEIYVTVKQLRRVASDSQFDKLRRSYFELAKRKDSISETYNKCLADWPDSTMSASLVVSP